MKAKSIERELVVSRYQEDISWSLAFDGKVTIYNKGDDIHPPGPISVIKLKNHGREAHTMLHHLVHRYDDLADTTVFCQGNPFEHSPDFGALFNLRFTEVQPLSSYYSHPDIPPTRVIRKYKEYWHEGKELYVEYINHNLAPVLPEPYTDPGLIMVIIPHFRQNHRIGRNESIADFLWERFGINEPLPRLMPFSFGAQLSVPKQAILRHPKSVYETMLKWSTEAEYNAHVAERIWLTLFGYHLQETAPRYDRKPTLENHDQSKIQSLLVWSCHLSRDLAHDVFRALRRTFGRLRTSLDTLRFILFGR